uniref:NADP-dependent oxidoreductase domain-containing protein n=1 Tax=Romanomermis culicivorax TaxID=13658 RepID=A0A915KF37_ROMCU
YRFIDTAYLYGNEKVIGELLEDLLPKYQLKRRDIFLTSKLPTSHFGSKLALEAFKESLENLKTDYLDLYLIHFPRANNVDHSDHE